MLAGKHPENKATEITGNFRVSCAKFIYQVYIRSAQKYEYDTDSEFQTDALTPKSPLVHKLN